MSIRLMSQVWEINLSHAQQSILLALADHARDDGTKVFPSKKLVAWKTGYSERQVQRILKELRDSGLIEIVKEAHIHEPTEYKIVIANGIPKAPFRGDNMTPLDGKRGDTTVAGGETPLSQRGDIAVSPKPPTNHQKETSKTLAATLPDISKYTFTEGDKESLSFEDPVEGRAVKVNVNDLRREKNANVIKSVLLAILKSHEGNRRFFEVLSKSKWNEYAFAQMTLSAICPKQHGGWNGEQLDFLLWAVQHNENFHNIPIPKTWRINDGRYYQSFFFGHKEQGRLSEVEKMRAQYRQWQDRCDEDDGYDYMDAKELERMMGDKVVS